MARLAVITDPGIAAGFCLAGVEVHTAPTPEEAKRVLLALMEEGDVGVIAINSNYLSTFDEPTRRRIDESERPVVVALPTGAGAVAEGPHGRTIAEMVRRAVGLRITFPGETQTRD